MNNEEKILRILEGMQGDVSSLKEDVSSLKEQMSEANTRLSRVENRLTVIENDHGSKLNALFDGYSQLYEVSNEIRDDVKILKTSHSNHDIEITALKTKRAR